ncbi:MAG TPA: trypsin-like peptidase domain-containing protein [Phycisphaerae bacterium]|nr:trypsin-like peptidase domain-containing protein [Phycisphaerae bacterium]
MGRAVRSMLTVLLLAASVPAAERATPARDARVTPVVLAYRKARPAVVNISSEKIVSRGLGLFGGDPFDEIFPSPFRRRVPVQSLGSGVVIHPDGYLVTNAHVVRQAQKITVTTSDNKKYEAKVISADQSLDLAVVKVDLPPGVSLPHLPLGRSDDLMVGETVIAIGNPMGYANTLTTGVISAVGRDLEFREGVKIAGLIQTDAPINPGNSGGPLLNVHAQWIGINTAIRADAQNIGFAIPVDSLARELPDLLDFERANRVIFGAAVAQRHGESQTEVFVKSVRPETPAAGKLHEGDRILALNGKPIRQIPDFACAMLAADAGTKVRLRLRRGDKSVSVEVTLAAKPKPNGKVLAEQLFGMTLRPVTAELARSLRLRVDRGLLVVGIESGSPAERLGLKLKDVLFQVGRFYVKDLDALGITLEEVKPGDPVRIGIVRGNVQAWAAITARQASPATKDAER